MRAHIDIIGMMPTVCTLMAKGSPNAHRSSTLAKHIHRYTHTPRTEMLEILSRAAHREEQVTKLCQDIVESSQVCTRSGQPGFSKMASLMEVFEAFNHKPQVHFIFINVRGSKNCVLHAVDIGTTLSKPSLVSYRSAQERPALL